ncbi:hypothetical protein AVEN_231296-1 [Araneus ventricosus]|uniref:Uncharacterized protein n=1 Tax=Araneus ventricosus TaxID=182803 RepID=A0A4Y2CHC4_ARAVE|nr:hypothetical protein AVEN_231296-1 [Araneus ventricosus]
MQEEKLRCGRRRGARFVPELCAGRVAFTFTTLCQSAGCWKEALLANCLDLCVVSSRLCMRDLTLSCGAGGHHSTCGMDGPWVSAVQTSASVNCPAAVVALRS